MSFFLLLCVRSQAGPSPSMNLKNSGVNFGGLQQQQQQNHSNTLMREQAASLQVAVITSLRCLSYEGEKARSDSVNC